MSEMVSFGCGVNSVAMIIMLVNGGWHGPIVFADTGGEHVETYCYMDYFGKWLAERELEITRLSPGSEWHTQRISIPLEQFCLEHGIIPYLAARWCSIQWKQEPLTRWAKAMGIETCLLGFAAEESRRVMRSQQFDASKRYPLYEADVTRAGCRDIITDAGLDIPIKSGCFFCPGQRLAGWKRLYYDHPELYNRAIQLEECASVRRGKPITLDPHGISLREHARRRWEGQLEMDLSRWLPCACAL